MSIQLSEILNYYYYVAYDRYVASLRVVRVLLVLTPNPGIMVWSITSTVSKAQIYIAKPRQLLASDTLDRHTRRLQWLNDFLNCPDWSPAQPSQSLLILGTLHLASSTNILSIGWFFGQSPVLFLPHKRQCIQTSNPDSRTHALKAWTAHTSADGYNWQWWLHVYMFTFFATRPPCYQQSSRISICVSVPTSSEILPGSGLVLEQWSPPSQFTPGGTGNFSSRAINRTRTLEKWDPVAVNNFPSKCLHWVQEPAITNDVQPSQRGFQL
jgi:hypothetical protein